MAGNISTQGRTSEPTYVLDAPGSPKYQVIPLLTVGDEVPLLTSTFSNTTAPTVDSSKLFAFTGIPNANNTIQVKIDGKTYNYVWVSYGLAGDVTTDISTTATGEKITGGRVSLYVFDENWKVIGGKNLIETITDLTGTYTLDTATGLYTNSQGGSLANLEKFSSAYLATSGFVDSTGNEVPLLFGAKEGEGDTGLGLAITPDGEAVALEGLGQFAKQNIVAASEYRAIGSAQTVLLITENSGDGELYMWVGEQTVEDPNGLKNGDLYVLKVDSAEFEGDITTEGTKKTATWTKVDKSVIFNPDGTPKVDGTDLTTFVNTTDSSSNFQRLQGIAEDPSSPGTFYFTTAGTNAIKGQGDTNGTTEIADEAENPYGRLYRFSLNTNDPTATIDNFELLLIGGQEKGVNYGNIVVNKSGRVLIQENATAFGVDIITQEEREAGIWAYNPKKQKIVPLFALDEGAAGNEFNDPAIPGEWSTSGIIEVGTRTVKGQSAYLFNVQADSITGTSVLNGNHGQGGQLVLAVPFAYSRSEKNVLSINNFDDDDDDDDDDDNDDDDDKKQTFRFQLKSRAKSQKDVREYGCFEVDDDEGGIDHDDDDKTANLKPGEAGYEAAFILRKQIIFATLADGLGGDGVAKLTLKSSGKYLFYQVQNFSQSRQSIIFGNSSSNLTITEFQRTETIFSSLQWSDESILEVESTTDSLTQGVNYENNSAIIDLRSVTGSISVSYTLHREAAYDNLVGFCQVDDANGTINGNTPGASNFNRQQYIQDALNSRRVTVDLTVANQSSSLVASSLTGGFFFAPFIVANGTLAQGLSNAVEVFFSYGAANQDGQSHIINLGNNMFGFEDILGASSDFDYNDMVLNVGFELAIT